MLLVKVCIIINARTENVYIMEYCLVFTYFMSYIDICSGHKERRLKTINNIIWRIIPSDIYSIPPSRFILTVNIPTVDSAISRRKFIDDIIECPVHQGRFHIPTGKPKGAPVSVALDTYATRVEDGKVYVQLNSGD